MNDIELNKVIELARICNKNNCGDCRKKYRGEGCFSIDATIPSVVSTITTLADRIDALTAENAEKDKRIKELEAGQKRGIWSNVTHVGMWPVGSARPVATCSLCDGWSVKYSNYCPNCGAKMDGE